MAQQQRIGTHATAIIENDGFIQVVYHSTSVVSFNSEKVILKTGGHRSNTTKTRMNQTANQFNLGFRVFQKDFEWYVQTGLFTLKMEGEQIEFPRS